MRGEGRPCIDSPCIDKNEKCHTVIEPRNFSHENVAKFKEA